MRHLKFVFSFAVPLLLLPVLAWAQDPGTPDTVRIDSIAVNSVFSEQTVDIPIYVTWDECLTAIVIPIWVMSSDVDLDTAIFTGGFAATASLKSFVRDPGNPNKAKVYAQEFFSSWCGNGNPQLFATLKVTVPAATPAQCVLIDSTTLVSPTNSLIMIDDGFPPNNWIPRFIPGKINITDGCGVNNPPIISCPGSQDLDIGQYVNFTVTATDDGVPASPLTMTAENVPGWASFFDNGDNSGTFSGTPGCGDPGQYVVRFIADDSELADTCLVTVTVYLDNESPVAICPGDKTVDNESGQCGAHVSFTVDATDNCPGATAMADPVSGSFFPVGTTPVEVIATDASGNMDLCYFNVTVNDTERPVPDCPENLTVDTDPGECDAIVSFAIDATDNCPGVIVEADPPSGSVFNPGITQVEVIATAATGDADTCYFDVTVNDNEDPEITCPDNMTVDCDPGQNYATVYYQATATDNCGIGTIDHDPASGSTFAEGTTTPVAVMAIDINGNHAICAFTVTVNSSCDCGAVWGDTGGDGEINPVDVVCMVNYVYKNIDARVQPPSCPYEAGDVNCDSGVNPQDVVHYVNYVYKNIIPWPCMLPCGP